MKASADKHQFRPHNDELPATSSARINPTNTQASELLMGLLNATGLLNNDAPFTTPSTRINTTATQPFDVLKKLQSENNLLNTEEAAAYLGVTPGTLEVWRCTKRYNLAYIKVGRLVRYRRGVLDAFLAARTVEA